MNNCVLIGRLTKEPELNFLKSGLAVCNFTLAIDKNLSKEKRQEMESKGQPTADFINIVVWGKQAESCANYLDKGTLTAVQGRIQTRSYEANDGTRRYVTEVVAERVQFLEWKKQDNDIEGFSQANEADLPF
jgi:single-strand DNA-binding protein|nr:MAG TPA: Single strand binding protein [Caudoviricetes sp.]